MPPIPPIANYLQRMREAGKRIIDTARIEGKQIIILAGRPYHVDPEVGHGIDKLLGAFNVAVLSEDAISHMVEKFPVHVLNQWTYHSRLYAAAKAIADQDDMQLVQLVSFGCGVDAITSDETRDILEAAGKMYTQIKIAMRSPTSVPFGYVSEASCRRLNSRRNHMHIIEPVFTREMRETHTILAPSMAKIQFRILVEVLKDEGYTVKLLENEGPQVIRKGLKYVHNDTCYPALLVIGQMLDALDSGIYDLEHTALAITQTGGGCRASNYIHLLRKALDKAGYTNIPIVSLNLKGMNRNSGFRITYKMLRKGIAALVCGDTLMLLKNQVSPYEVHHGKTQELVDSWVRQLSEQYRRGSGYTKREMAKDLRRMVAEFSAIETDYNRPVVKVGIVGEIYMKYAPLGNNHLEDFLASQSCEVMVPGLLGFLLYGLQNQLEDIDLYGGSRIRYAIMGYLKRHMITLETLMIDAVARSGRFTPPCCVPPDDRIGKGGDQPRMQDGRGLALDRRNARSGGNGVPEYHLRANRSAVYPNHIVGKGMIRRLKELDDDVNIVPIDYDPGATRVNQENRIKLMLAVANENRILDRQDDR